SQESCDAVALLMRDVGYACNMGYRKYESAGVLRPSSLCNYFDYDNDMRYLARSMCDADTWNSIILDELVNGRPLYYAGYQSSESGSGHALVIDGYDGNGYFHFNYGWGGLNNGYYTMLTISYGYGAEIKYRIKKNEGGKPGYLFYSSEDFAYVPETDRLVAYHLGWEDRDRNEAGVTIQVALAVENIDTHEIQYYYISVPDSRVNILFQLTEVLPDGNYFLYPVARKDQNYAWEIFFFKEERQSFVDLNVTNGVKTYANNHISDNIQKGTIVVDGIYYILDETNHEAKVSYKNDKYNSYSGDVIIPANIEYENQQYSVTRIGSYAFSHSDKLTSVVIPSSVTYIESNAFSESGLKSIEIPNSVKTIGSCVFSDCRQLSSASISSILKEIPWGTFQVCALKEILIPQSVTSIVNSAFWQCNLSDVYVEWGDPSTVNCVVEAFDSYSTCTLHVPVGSKDAYASTVPWSKFQNIVEDESLGIGDVRYDPNGEKHSDIYTVNGVKVNTKDLKTMPKGVYIQGKKKVVKK
ncbi:MAG: C10 family peptidase, partial [Prevotella sp.]|nr:C10 family peptidase [Prevotella sp.]